MNNDTTSKSPITYTFLYDILDPKEHVRRTRFYIQKYSVLNTYLYTSTTFNVKKRTLRKVLNYMERCSQGISIVRNRKAESMYASHSVSLHRTMIVLSFLFAVFFVTAFGQEEQEEKTINVLVGFSSRLTEDFFLISSSIVNGDEPSYKQEDQLSASVANMANNRTQDNHRGPKRPKKQVHEFQYTNAVSMKITREELEVLEQDPNVLYVEEDPLMYALDAPLTSHLQSENTKRILQESVSYGLSRIQGDIDIPAAHTENSCLVNVCIVDSGLHVDHVDIPYDLDEPNFIEGNEFGLGDGQFWYNAQGIDHGTQVAGIMVAKGGNNQGVIGVIPEGPETSKVCLLIARVFADFETSTSSENVLQAVEWCASKGAHVVNLSLGGTNAYSQTLTDAFQAISEDGVLLLGAAGNEGTEELFFPASLDSVMSIAAVDQLDRCATFSQRNNKVELTAPGDEILTTTYEDNDREMIIYFQDFLLSATKFELNVFDPNFDFELSREVVDCEFGLDECDDAAGKACLMKRDGEHTFYNKALNCQNGGGSMALIYNNINESLEGTLGRFSDTISIPVLGLSLDDGNLIKNNLQATITAEDVPTVTGFVSGTSFSTPFVAAVAAKLWAARPACTNEEIREALVNSAFPLYAQGDNKQKIPNKEHGYGLVQAQEAYSYIIENMEEPCGEANIKESPTLTPPVSESPTLTPPTCKVYGEPCTVESECCTGLTCRRSTLTGSTCRPARTAFRKAKAAYCRYGTRGCRGRQLSIRGVP